MTTEMLDQIKAAKAAVQLAMEMCAWRSEIGARLNTIWAELDNTLQLAEGGEYD